MSTAEEAKRFYDETAPRKLRDFIFGNRRIDRALETIASQGGEPGRILEVGCGVGSVCWRLADRFPHAEIVGVDFSQGNLAIAERVFSRPNVKFLLMTVDDEFTFGAFDLIILMDVFEHVRISEREALARNLRASLSPGGRVILTVPTPRHLAWLKANQPSEIQPVDEDITLEVFGDLASALGRDVLLYREVGAWRQGDYAHCVIGRSQFPDPQPAAARGPIQRIVDRLRLRERMRFVAKSGIGI
ncbi:MAG TPA: class I SAM-dependent methyltransferase [Vicinamibacterales bacterium]|nr:class I SAM-dependent methyltransferase [Vicinamibacterales bacterium]